MNDLISRQAAIDICRAPHMRNADCSDFEMAIMMLPPAELSTNLAEVGTDCISRQDAIALWDKYHHTIATDAIEYDAELRKLPSAQPEKEKAKRVLWTGWKGCRYTRYNCPNCKKPVRNDDVYCHRCGQKLMFPKVSHTPYVEGQKQEVIVRWDDE